MARTNNARSRPGAGGPAGPRIPEPQPVTYYAGPNKLDPELLDSKAEQWARKFSKVSASQLRRFYEDVLSLKKRLQLEATGTRQEAREKAFDRLRADFKMLKAKAVYAYGRSEKQFPRDCLQFFVNHVHAVRTARDFDAFAKHFEAVLAFHKALAEK